MTTATAFADLCKINVASTGTGAVTLGSAVSGFQGASALTNGQTYAYSIIGSGTYENGHGVYTSSGTSLTRVVDDSSSSGSAITLVGTEFIIVGHILASDAALMLPDLGSVNISPAGKYAVEVSVTDARVLTTSTIMVAVSGSMGSGSYPDELELEPAYVYARCITNGTMLVRLVSRGRMFANYTVKYTLF